MGVMFWVLTGFYRNGCNERNAEARWIHTTSDATLSKVHRSSHPGAYSDSLRCTYPTE